MLAREDLLWCRATKVSQQALSLRFLTFPAELLERVFKDLLPKLQQNCLSRDKRPLPDSIKFALHNFERIWVADGSTLEALFRKLKSLEDAPKGQLAGKICTVIDIVTRLPVEVWFHNNPRANDTNFEADLLKLVTAKTLLLLDRGFYHFQFFADLINEQVDFVTRLKAGAAVKVVQVFTSQNGVRDQLIKLGMGRNGAPILTLRLVEIRCGKTWYSYLTSVLDPVVLPPYVVAFNVAYDKGKATDPIKYFAAPENQDLGVIKTIRKPLPNLDLSPFPGRKLPPKEFPTTTLLTNCSLS